MGEFFPVYILEHICARMLYVIGNLVLTGCPCARLIALNKADRRGNGLVSKESRGEVTLAFR